MLHDFTHMEYKENKGTNKTIRTDTKLLTGELRLLKGES